MRQSYDRFFARYCHSVERDSRDDKLLRGAFCAGLQHALCFARLSPDLISAELDRATAEIDAMWVKAEADE